MAIKEIWYKKEKIYGFLSGIQLHFANGFKTEMYETSLAKDEAHELKKVVLPDNTEISQIKIKYEEYPDRN